MTLSAGVSIICCLRESENEIESAHGAICERAPALAFDA